MLKFNGSLTVDSARTNNTRKDSLNNSFTFSNEQNREDKQINTSSKKLNLLRMNHMNRSNSVDVVTQRNKQTTNESKKNSAKCIDVNTHTLIELHKFLKDNFKRRTIVLVRSANKKVVTPLGSSKLRHNLQPNESNAANSQGEFGFHLQTYGLVNSSTKQTEFICFCNNVQPQSPAQQAGLNNGDVILAIDDICIDKFKSLNEIMSHVRGKLELRLVIMAENICKKIQLKQRYAKLKQIISDKKLELDRITKQEETILKKYFASSSHCSDELGTAAACANVSANSSNESSNTDSSSTDNISNELSSFISPVKPDTSNEIKNSTPIEQTISSSSSSSANASSSLSSSSSSTSSTSSLVLTPLSETKRKVSTNINTNSIIAAVMCKSNESFSTNISKSSPNGTARITVNNNNTFTSPLANPSKSVSSFDETPASHKQQQQQQQQQHASFTSFSRPDLLVLKQTPRMSRSALSSSMNFINKLNINLNLKTPLRQQAIQITQPSLTRIDDITNAIDSLNDSVNKGTSVLNKKNDDAKLIKISNYVTMSDSSFTPVLSSMSTSSTSSSLSSASSISPNLSLTNSITDKSFNTMNEIDSGVGVGIGLVVDTVPNMQLNNMENLNSFPIFKYASENYVITRL